MSYSKISISSLSLCLHSLIFQYLDFEGISRALRASKSWNKKQILHKSYIQPRTLCICIDHIDVETHPNPAMASWIQGIKVVRPLPTLIDNFISMFHNLRRLEFICGTAFWNWCIRATSDSLQFERLTELVVKPCVVERNMCKLAKYISLNTTNIFSLNHCPRLEEFEIHVNHSEINAVFFLRPVCKALCRVQTLRTLRINGGWVSSISIALDNCISTLAKYPSRLRNLDIEYLDYTGCMFPFIHEKTFPDLQQLNLNLESRRDLLSYRGNEAEIRALLEHCHVFACSVDIAMSIHTTESMCRWSFAGINNATSYWKIIRPKSQHILPIFPSHIGFSLLTSLELNIRSTLHIFPSSTIFSSMPLLTTFHVHIWSIEIGSFKLDFIKALQACESLSSRLENLILPIGHLYMEPHEYNLVDFFSRFTHLKYLDISCHWVVDNLTTYPQRYLRSLPRLKKLKIDNIQDLSISQRLHFFQDLPLSLVKLHLHEFEPLSFSLLFIKNIVYTTVFKDWWTPFIIKLPHLVSICMMSRSEALVLMQRQAPLQSKKHRRDSTYVINTIYNALGKRVDSSCTCN
ncbi:MAG: hypothetical protein Sylvanvirus42_5 [Sylvanvirus sp.]|uniref:F-box domain-containing protein n=1 Tax=Sylvanvirus sp. TaxID=2487774 RepID=A0A3G5ALM4_9VIRU|nr:MAG: hypothetical protein Sylvanvirus42_5 [Sylvanvirus sp.]